MPKRSTGNKPFWGGGSGGGGGGGGGRGRQANNSDDRSRRDYFSHDDRTGRPNNDGQRHLNNRQRVTFKKTLYKPDPVKKSRFIKQLDDDILMSAGSNNNSRPVVNRGRGKIFPRGRNSPLPRGHMRMDSRRPLNVSETNWYRVIIPHGNKYAKDFILGNLLSMIAPSSFTPIAYKVQEGSTLFYVEDHALANKLLECDNRITTADGFKLRLRVMPGQPQLDISDEGLKERLKLAMAKRYNQESCALDLSKFHHDSDLAIDYFCPLFRPQVLSAVIDIVHAHIPGLRALKLDSNKLQATERLSSLAEKFENLKILHVADNKIREVSHLNALKQLQLEELNLAGNPVCNKYKNKEEDYINDVRKIFPKLLKLDGRDLPPPIVFDVEEQVTKLPITQKMFIAHSNAKAQEIASQFLQQYFIEYDSESRSRLLEAYHENALFSMNVNVTPRFAQYHHSENCNILRISDKSRRDRLKKCGKLPIVTLLTEMPRTKHDLSSFTMDLCIATEGMIFISLTGLFKELNSKDNKEYLRYFDRQFVIAPENAGFCVHEEHLSIVNATAAQEKRANTAVLAPQPVPGPSAVPAVVNPLTEEVKQQMAIQLSQDTKMLPEWSYKCLEEVQWNYETAQVAFRDALNLNKIPPNAFIH